MSTSIIGQTLLNQYHVEEFITSTPLGELYRATDNRNNKLLGLTLLPRSIADNAEAFKELESKSARLQAITHPNLVKYYGLFQTPTLAFLLEDWVDGLSIKDILAKGPVLAEEALVYAKAVCRGLDALHSQKYLHLNLAPELIRVNQRGEIFLSGIADALPIPGRSPHELGKYPPLYTSPEQLQFKKLAPAADIYSLAVILYKMTTGVWINGKQAPKTNEAIKRVHNETVPPAPSSLNKQVPDHFSRMLAWALRKDPEDRLKTTTELISSLSLALHISVDEVPHHADPKATPSTSAALREWAFLPPPKAVDTVSDTIPLDERLSALTLPKKKKSRVRFVPILLAVLFIGFFALFWFIRPADIEIALPTPIQFTQVTAVIFTPRPTFTPSPRPTDPHGGRIVFTCTRGDYNQVCMVNRDGSEYIQVTDMAASNYYPILAPGGGSLLFASNRNGSFDFFLLSFTEKLIFQVTDNVGNVISPDYSPDGRFIVFANRVGDNPTSIWMVNADGLNPKLVYTGARDIAAVSWSPDGGRIAYAMSGLNSQEYQIYTMDANGRNHLLVSQGLQGIGGSVDWSPDGKYLLVYAGPVGDKNIFRVEADTGAFAQLTNGGNNAGASYSPDGLYIVFNSLRNDDQADLYIMRADGTNQVQLTNHPEPDWGARWTE